MPTNEIPSYERMRRIGLAVSPRLDHAMRVLGLTPEANADDGVPADGAAQVTAALVRYSESIARATAELEKMLERKEWNYLADVLNGCADLWDWSESPIPSTVLIRANAEDAHRLDRTGDKWFGEELEPGSGDKGVKALFRKLAALTPVQGDAILAAVRHFWRHCRTTSHQEHKWWTVAYRSRPAESGA